MTTIVIDADDIKRAKMRPSTSYKIGTLWRTKEGYDVEVLDYLNASKILVKFKDEQGYTTYAESCELKRGSLRNPFHPSVLGIGYFGVGPYLAKFKGKMFKEYRTWVNVLSRCYKNDGKSPSYYGRCTVHPAWHNYQVFAQWCNEQPHFHEENFELDKDILLSGNTVYGPFTCRIIPSELNGAVSSCLRLANGKKLHLGVSKLGNGYTAHSCGEYLGYFPTEEAAHEAYREHREARVRQLAEKYKQVLPHEIYDALLNFKIGREGRL